VALLIVIVPDSEAVQSEFLVQLAAEVKSHPFP
jgi:hypothetical protein